MFYGNCVSHKNITRIKILKDTGFDYIETQLAPMYSAEEHEITKLTAALEENNIKCEAVNVLFPGGINLTGEQADLSKVSDYVGTIFEKTKILKYKTVVFGSGGARRRPEGFPEEKAIEQIINVIKNYLLPAADKYDFTLTLEELNRGETNIINTIEQAEYIINEVNNPRVKLLADLYHMALENDDVTVLSKKINILSHCHVANPYNNRYYPHENDSGESVNLYKKYFGSLKSAGYTGGISIEGGLGGLADITEVEIPDWVGENDKTFYAESKKSLEFMKKLVQTL